MNRISRPAVAPLLALALLATSLPVTAQNLSNASPVTSSVANTGLPSRPIGESSKPSLPVMR